MQILDKKVVNNAIGTFYGCSVAVPPNAISFTLTADMTSQEASDTTDTLRLGIFADTGSGELRLVKWSDEWTGGPGKSAPSLTYKFPPGRPPNRIQGVVENITQVATGLRGSFS